MNRRGFVLLVTLLLLLLFAVLVMNILLQGQIAMLIARNERDATTARNYAENMLAVGKRIITEYANSIPKPENLSRLLEGPNASSPNDDNLLDLSPWKQLNMGINSVNQLHDSGEKRSAGMIVRNFDGIAKRWEFFELGDANGNWDVTRTVIYLRIEDNYDDGNDIDFPISDQDFRVNLLVVAEYPVIISKRETITRGVSRCQIHASFAPDESNTVRMVEYEEVQ